MTSASSSFTLPALKSLGDLAGAKPTIVIDSREQLPLTFTRLQSVEGTLYSGDYSVRGLEELFAVECKTVADLTACCCGDNRMRFERELHRLRGFKFKRLVVVGSRDEIETQHYHSRISPGSVLGSLGAWEVRFDVPVVFCPTAVDAARKIEGWVWYFTREIVEVVNELCRATAGGG